MHAVVDGITRERPEPSRTRPRICIFGISEDGDSSPSCTCLRGSSGNSTRAHASSPSRTRPLTSYKRSDNARSPSRMHPRFKRRWVCRLPCTPLQPERPHRRQSAYTHQPIARRVRVFFRLALCSIPEIDLHPPLHTLEKEKPRYRFDSRVSLLYLVGRAGVEPTTNGLKVRCSTN